jgi:hypothetical protein
MVVDRGEFFSMLQRLDGFYRAPEGLQRADGLVVYPGPTPQADFEGIAAWGFDTYLNAREQGQSPEQAYALVIRNIVASDEWKQKHPNSGGGGDWPSVPVFRPAPRTYMGDMCGVEIDGLPLLPGTKDPRLVLSWFYDRYALATDRRRIRDTWRAEQYTDTLRSWPDARAFGLTPQEFIGLCVEQRLEGDELTVMLLSDEIDGDIRHNVPALVERANEIAPGIIASRAIGRICISFEMNEIVTPEESVELVKALCPQFVAAGIKCYVHLSPGWFSMLANPPSTFTQNQVFWNATVGHLTGLMAQARPGLDKHGLQDWISDCLERCAGFDNMPVEMIDGHGVDFIMLENGSSERFDGTLSETDCRDRGRWAIETPGRVGPAGNVHVMGAGNGYR